jgi:hypothetical protein
LAATICAWLELPHEIAKTMSEDEVLALVDFDHFPIRHGDGGLNIHWNIRPLLRHDHKEKTKRDASDRAKERHVRQAVDEHAQRMLLKSCRALEKRSRWASRPFPKRRKK